MNEIAGIYHIIENRLNKKNYFQSLLREGHEIKAFDDGEAEKIQLSLLNLITKQVNRYTSFESTSVRTEKAQQIFESICYCIGVYLKTVPGIDHQLELLKPDNLESLFVSGSNTIKEYIEGSKAMLLKLQSEALKINNHAYSNTIFNGIDDYIRDYDVKYAAQEEGGSIDYPLAIGIMDLTGFEYMKEYLTRLTLENDFCKEFSESYIELLLKGYQEDYPELLINIYEIIFTNALGLILLDKDFYYLDISDEDRLNLKTSLAGHTVSQLQDILISASEKLYEKMEINNKELLNYMKKTAHLLSHRLMHQIEMNKLDMFFISLNTAVIKEEPKYQDGQSMEDEKLRRLIYAMQDLSDISDKVAMVQKHIHSLRDLVEILDICFYEDEFNEVFKLLSKSEASVLLGLIDEKKEKDWQKALKNYLSTIE